MAQNTTIQKGRVVPKTDFSMSHEYKAFSWKRTLVILLLSVVLAGGSLTIQFYTNHALHFKSLNETDRFWVTIGLFIVSLIVDVCFVMTKLFARSMVSLAQKRELEMLSWLTGAFIAFGIVGRFFITDAIWILCGSTVASISSVIWLKRIFYDLDPVELANDAEREAMLQAQYTAAFEATASHITKARMIREIDRRANKMAKGLQKIYDKRYGSKAYQSRMIEYSEYYNTLTEDVLDGTSIFGAKDVTDVVKQIETVHSVLDETEVKQSETVNESVSPVLLEIRDLQMKHDLDAGQVAFDLGKTSMTAYIASIMSGSCSEFVGLELAQGILTAMKSIILDNETALKQPETPFPSEIDLKINGDGSVFGFQLPKPAPSVKQPETDVKQQVLQYEERQRTGAVSLRQIAAETGVSYSKVNRILGAYRQNSAICEVGEGETNA